MKPIKKLANRLSNNKKTKNDTEEEPKEDEMDDEQKKTKTNIKILTTNTSMDTKYRRRQADQLPKLNRTKDKAKHPKESTLQKYHINAKTDEKGHEIYHV